MDKSCRCTYVVVFLFSPLWFAPLLQNGGGKGEILLGNRRKRGLNRLVVGVSRRLVFSSDNFLLGKCGCLFK